MPAPSIPALFETMVRFFVPLRRTAAIKFSGMPHNPNPPIKIVAPSRSFSIARSALATRLSIPALQELFLESQPISERSLLHVAEYFVEFVGGIELGLKLAAGKSPLQVLDSSGETVKSARDIIGIGKGNIPPHGIGASGEAQGILQARSGERNGQACFVSLFADNSRQAYRYWLRQMRNDRHRPIMRFR